MLVLNRYEGERIAIDVGHIRVWVQLVEVDRGKVKLGFSGPREAVITREELLPESERHEGRAGA